MNHPSSSLIRLLLAALLAAAGLGAAAQQMPREYRAVWLTTLKGLDWPSQPARDAAGIERQKADLCQILDRLREAGINTVLFQTRLRATTAYPSDIEPWDGIFSGKAGRSPGYDPLQFALDEAHRRGMELHAWVVAFPINKTASVRELGDRALPRRHPELCRRAGDQYFLDPGVPGAADYIASVCREIVSRYAVDGIHLDYIRYPEKSYGFNDAETFRRYGRDTGMTLADWRRDNVTRTVRTIAAAVRGVRPWVKLSCSPVGKYADAARYSSKGWNARDAVSQDAVTWLNEGSMDVLFPMMYFDGDHFYPFAQDWKERCGDRPVVPGLGIYFMHPRERDWPLEAVQRQMNLTRQLGMGGYAFFRSRFFTDNTKGLYDWARDRFNRTPPVLTPAATAVDSLAPTVPAAVIARSGAHTLRIAWAPSTDNTPGAPIYYNVYREAHGTWLPLSVRQTATAYECAPALPALLHARYAVTALDAFGNESPARIVCLDSIR